MKLLYQLGLVSLTLLLVPWAGCAFLTENERALQQAQAQAATAVAATTAAALSERSELLYPYPELRSTGSDHSLLALPLKETPRLDGWLDDWQDVPAQRFGNRRRYIEIRTGRFASRLYLAVTVQEPDPRYRSPQRRDPLHSDQLQIRWGDRRTRFLSVAPEGPGKAQLRITRADGTITGIEDDGAAWWQEIAGGYQIEVALDLALLRGRLAVDYLGVDDSGREILGNRPTTALPTPPRLITADPALGRWLKRMAQPGMRLQVFDHQQWPLGSAGDFAVTNQTHTFWLLRRLYRSLLPAPDYAAAPRVADTGRVTTSLLAGNEGVTATIRDQGTALLTATAPVLQGGEIAGVVMVSQPAEQFLSLTDGAFASLLGRGLLMLGISAAALLGFATLTSWRIRRLIVRLQGQPDDRSAPPKLPTSLLGDEIDSLATRFNQQIAELADYQRYLTSLNQTLAHELRTPVAIVASSLDNLNAENLSADEQRALLERAREGIGRLQALFSALQEARRLEQAVAADPMERTDLRAMLESLANAYRQTYSEHAFSLETDVDFAAATVAPEQIVQALDKLVNNASTYAPRGSTIRLRLEARGLWWRISVANEGPLLPEVEARALFEPLISHRSHQDRSQHMGLGLHIVRLIARNHGGEPFASNIADGSGVVVGFSVRAAISPQTPAV